MLQGIMQNSIWLKDLLTPTKGLYVAKFLSEVFLNLFSTQFLLPLSLLQFSVPLTWAIALE